MTDILTSTMKITDDDLLHAGVAIVAQDIPILHSVARAIADERDRVIQTVVLRVQDCECVCDACLRRELEP